ncbi:hypothetical protein GQ600_16509 [Phytophthora cactorum]|nr:hypothetical protein GQ600_16509 [Phytophthora cactorum]
MEVLRPLSSPSSKSVANVWERLLQTFSVPAPVANRFLVRHFAPSLYHSHTNSILSVFQPN